MKGLSTNTKTIATLFLFVCLAANSQVFQSNFQDSVGSKSIASSADIERSSVLPSKAKNCVLKPGTETTAEEFTAKEKDIVNSDILRKKVSDENVEDESNMSARERREAARKRREGIRNTTDSNKKITFKLNYKTYVCEDSNGTATTKLEYELKNVDTPEGSIECPGDCKVGVSQTAAFEDIANKILNSGIKDEINLKYELAKLKIIDQSKADNCEGELEKYSDGSTELFEYGDNDEDDKDYRECLVRRTKELKNNRDASLDMFDRLEIELSALAESKDLDDRKEALKLINSLHGRSGRGLHEEIRATVQNIKQFALGATKADDIDNEFDKQIKYFSEQSCSVNQSAGCLNDNYVQAKIETLKMQRDLYLNSEKNIALNEGWRITNNEGGDESYKLWHTNLTNYFEQTMKQIQDIYTGPESINQKLDTDSPSDISRYNYLTGKSDYNDLRSTVSTLGQDVGPVPNIFTRK